MLKHNQHDLWWQQPLIRHLMLVLVVKLALIFGLWWLFFDMPEEHEINMGRVAAHITGGTTPPIGMKLETMK